MSKKIFYVMFLTLFVLSSLAFNAQELGISDRCLTANASYDPLTVIANITLGKHPYCIATNEETNRVYVGVEGGILVINGQSDQIIAEIPLGDDVEALAVNSLTNRIYAGIFGENVAVIDGATNLKLGEIPENLYNSYELAVNPVTNRVYAADWTTLVGVTDKVRVYNGENFQFVASVDLGIATYVERVGVAVNPNTNKVYAMWTGNNSLFMIDGITNLITKSVVPSFASETVMVNPYTNYVYVGTAILNGETLEPVTPSLTGEIKAIDPVHNLLYTVSGNTNLSRLDGSTHDLIDSLKLHWSFGIWSNFDRVAVNPTTSKIYITHYDGNETCVVSTGTPPADITPPTTAHDYDFNWHASDFTINLNALDSGSGVATTYYRINSGSIQTVGVNGQPHITTEGAGNSLEYWSVDNVGNEELPHKVVTGIKLDKTTPQGSIQINSGAAYTNTTAVNLSLLATDSGSGVSKMCFSNDGSTFSNWEAYATSKSWSITAGDGAKNVHVQFKDDAGLTVWAYQTITLDTVLPVANAGQNQNSQVGQTVTFSGAGSTDNNGILSYVWNFGDGNIGTGVAPTHIYSSVGTYTVSLMVKDIAGNSAASSSTVSVQVVIPEFPSLLFPSLLFVAVTLGVAFFKKKVSLK